MLFTKRCKIQAKHDKEGDKKLTKSRQSLSSKTMLEVSSLRTNTSSKSFAPLINSHVDSRLFNAAPNFNQPLLRFIDGVDFPLVYNTLMNDSPDLVINWIEIWTVCRPQIWSNEVWCFSTQNLQFYANIHTSVSFTR